MIFFIISVKIILKICKNPDIKNRFYIFYHITSKMLFFQTFCDKKIIISVKDENWT